MSTFLLCQKALSPRCEVFERFFLPTGAKRYSIDTIPGWELRLYTDFHGNPPKVVQLAPEASRTVSKVVLINWQGKDTLLQNLDWGSLSANTLKRLRNLCSHILLISPDEIVVHQDEMGTHAIYTSFNHSIVSNSFLAVADLIGGRLSRYDMAIYEYLINGALFGQTTFFNEIKRVSHHHDVYVCQQYARLIPFSSSRTDLADTKDLDRLVSHHKTRLLDYFSELAINEDTQLSFSGGYDSRLLLACTQALGFKPRLFVYGKESDSDVKIARLITEKEQLKLTVVDKSAEQADSHKGKEDPLTTFYSFDGWKVEHGLFDGGVDRLDRLRRNSHGQSSMNGSLGEIYRNFYYAPSYRTSLADLCNTFYAQCNFSELSAFNYDSYQKHMIHQMQSNLHLTKVGERASFEELYPHFRGRFWAGRDIHINANFGKCFFPFMHECLSEGTERIPLKFKDQGRFQASLIQSINPVLASYQSDYGFTFDQAKPFSYQAKYAISVHKPSLLRRYSQTLKGLRQFDPYQLKAALTHDNSPVESLDIMSAFVNVDRLTDPMLIQRAITLEYLFQRYSA
jgi:hypothetical protein